MLRMISSARLRLPRALCAIVVSALALMANCSGGSHEPSVDSTRRPIFYGTSDTEREAVMAIVHAPNLETIAGSCSGTVIQAADGFAHMLTAAHCVGERDENGELLIPFSPIPPGDLLVIPGFDWAASPIAFTVQEYVVHPSYEGEAGSLHDLAVVRFYYGDSSDPDTMSPMTSAEDTLSEGASFTLVGYGRTENDDFNTERNQVDRDIYQLTTYSVVHLQAGGGTCMGDSGGPGIVMVGSDERIFAVSSAVGSVAGQDPCETGAGLGVRVSAYEDFIQEYLALAPEDPGCDACLLQASAGSCATESENCLTGTPCGDYLGCTELCTTVTCAQDCAVEHSQGYIDYAELYFCSCGACDACAAGSVCEELECGYSDADQWCDCERESCCEEALNCTRDATCLGCSTVPGFDLGCAENEALTDLVACLDGCTDECTTDSGGASGGVDMVNWRVPNSGTDEPVEDAGAEPEPEMPDAGAEDEPEQDEEPDPAGEAGSSGSDEDSEPTVASDGGCGCRLEGQNSDGPLPVVFLVAAFAATRFGRRRARGI